MIKKIHLIWIGSEVPSTSARPYKQRILKWCSLNADYEVNLWVAGKALTKQQRADVDDVFVMSNVNNIRVREASDKNVLVGMNDLFTNEVFTKYPNYGAASDILRCAILIKEGGAYFDTDIDPVSALGGMDPPNGVHLNSIAGAWTNDGLYATEVANPFFLRYRDVMIEKYKNAPKKELTGRRTDKELKNRTTQDYTGPGALCDTLESMGWGSSGPITRGLLFPQGKFSQDKSDCSWL